MMLYELIRTLEFDDPREGDDTYRVELLRSKSAPRSYRARVLRIEFFRIQPTFPQKDGQPAHEACDERVFVEDDIIDLNDFEAETDDAALEFVIGKLEQFLQSQA